MKKTLLLLLTTIFLLAGCALQTSQPRQAALENEPTPIPTPVIPSKPVYTVEEGEVVSQLTFTGRVGPAAETTLFFVTDGQVQYIYVERGDTVQAGDLIAELDTQALADQLILAEAALTLAQTRLTNVQDQLAIDEQRAEINLNMAQLRLDFAREQADDPPTEQQSFEIDLLALERDLAQLALDELDTKIDPVLQADVAQAELQVAQLATAMADALLTAPSDGQIISLNLSPGQSIQAEAPVGVIADVTALEVTAALRENQLSELTENMPVTLNVVNQPGDPVAGYIRQLPYPYGTGDEAELAARIAYQEPDAVDFELGDRIAVTVILEQRPNVLWLPPAAIRTFNGREFVVVQAGEGQQRLDVTLGIEGGGRVEITEGLSAGQVVIGP